LAAGFLNDPLSDAMQQTVLLSDGQKLVGKE
jgi:hypothetical protein